MRKIKQNQRISAAKKNANKKQWYREQMDLLDSQHYDDGLHNIYNNSDISDRKRMKVNYDLFNNILNTADFEYVCQPFGAEVGELPAEMTNRDISSGKIKAVLGMEMKNPFSWKIAATNEEATTRKEQFEMGKIREYVNEQVMMPIRQQVEIKYQEQLQDRTLSQEERQKIRQQIEAEAQSMRPDELKRYMERQHQDPAEVMTHQLLSYLIQKTDAKRKFNKMFKHAALSAKGIGYVGIINGEPEFWNVNSMRFDYDKSPDLEFVEDGEWATCEYPMNPSQIIEYFGDELTQPEIDRIYESWSGHRSEMDDFDFFALDERNNDYDDSSSISVLHGVWKSLRRVGFLTYRKRKGEKPLMMIVDEKYKLNPDAGDIKIEWRWIPEVYETWKIKIAEPIYVKMRPIPGQFKDIDNLYYCKLPYYGAIYDDMNSQPTAIMDRLKPYQYYMNILWYRFELLAASDKGKKVLMNINMIPDSAGIDIKKWQYFLESTPYMWYDPNEEGNGGGYADVNTVAKVIDLSYAGDMNKYIEMMEYVRQMAGRAVGITDQVEGQIQPREAVKNIQQGLIQTSNILEPYFELHNYTKRNILQALIEMAKIAYAGENSKKLTYTLDDMSIRTLEVDMGLIDASRLGLFVTNSAKAQEVKDLIRHLSQMALQNQKAELSDVITVIRQDGIVEAEETLKVAENNRRDYEQNMQREKLDAEQKENEAKRQREREKHEEEKEIVVLKETERRKTVVAQAALTGASFNPDQDVDNDGENDFIEIFRDGVDADIKRDKQQLDRDRFEHQKGVDARKLEQQDKKLEMDKAKSSQK